MKYKLILVWFRNCYCLIIHHRMFWYIWKQHIMPIIHLTITQLFRTMRKLKENGLSIKIMKCPITCHFTLNINKHSSINQQVEMIWHCKYFIKAVHLLNNYTTTTLIKFYLFAVLVPSAITSWSMNGQQDVFLK